MHPSRRSIVALIVGFTGALVASGRLHRESGPSPVVPIILLLGTVVAFSVYTAFVRRVGRGVDPLAVAAVTQVGALFFVIPACLFDVLNGGMLRGDSITPKAFGAVDLPRHRFRHRLPVAVPRAGESAVQPRRRHDVPHPGVRRDLLVAGRRRAPAPARRRRRGTGARGGVDQRAQSVSAVPEVAP